jgi:spore maturation protein SpmB
MMSVAWFQKINLWDKTILTYLGILCTFIGGIIWYFSGLSQEQIQNISSVASNLIIFSVIVSFIVLAIRKKVNVYDSFVEGAKDGFQTAIMIIPYLIAILVAIGVFRASGALEWTISGITWGFNQMGINADFIPALPTALMKPLSGSGARGMMVDVMKMYGADSFAGRVACTIQGSADTTFYILAVYFGSVGIKNTRYALTCGLIADFVGVVAAIFMAYLFFH